MANFTHLDGYAHLVGIPCISFSFGEFNAVVSLYGGQVLSWRTADGRERLFLSPRAVLGQRVGASASTSCPPTRTAPDVTS